MSTKDNNIKNNDAMKVIINDTYYVIVDPLNHTLYQKVKSSKTPRVVGYFSSFQHIFKRILFLENLTKHEEATIKEYMEMLADFENGLDKLLATTHIVQTIKVKK